MTLADDIAHFMRLFEGLSPEDIAQLYTYAMQSLLHPFAQIMTIATLRYFIIAGIPFILFYRLARRKFAENKIQRKEASSGDFRREVLNSLMTTLILAIIAVVVIYTPISKYTRIYFKPSDYPGWWLPLSVALALVIHDTYFYWMHRIMHHPALFRLTHLVHHKSTNPSPWTSYSFQFIEAWVEGAVLIPIVMILPMHPTGITLFAVVAFIINVYGHLGFEIMPRGFRKSFLFEIINTSVYHNVHHSKFKGNYGLYFRVWDRLMGTENPDYVKEYDRVQAKRFGTGDTKPIQRVLTVVPDKAQ